MWEKKDDIERILAADRKGRANVAVLDAREQSDAWNPPHDRADGLKMLVSKMIFKTVPAEEFVQRYTKITEPLPPGETLLPCWPDSVVAVHGPAFPGDKGFSCAPLVNDRGCLCPDFASVLLKESWHLESLWFRLLKRPKRLFETLIKHPEARVCLRESFVTDHPEICLELPYHEIRVLGGRYKSDFCLSIWEHPRTLEDLLSKGRRTWPELLTVQSGNIGAAAAEILSLYEGLLALEVLDAALEWMDDPEFEREMAEEEERE